MQKMYHILLTGNQRIDIEETAYRSIEESVLAKQDRMVSAGGVTFSAKDVKRVTSSLVEVAPEQNQLTAPEITAEQRQRNLRRIRWAKAYLLRRDKLGASIPKSEQTGYFKWIEQYNSPEAEAERALRAQFRAEHFATYFPDNEAWSIAFEDWKEVKEAQEIFTGKAV